MNAIALAVVTGCVGWRDSAGAGGKEPAQLRRYQIDIFALLL